MSRLTRDGKAEPVSRDQILRHYGDGGIFIFPVQLTTSRIGNLSWLINTLAIRDYHTYVHTYIYTCLLHTNSGRGKRKAHINWSMVKPKIGRQHPLPLYYWNYRED